MKSACQQGGNSREGRVIADPALGDHFTLTLFLGLPSDRSHADQTEAKEKRGGGFGDRGDITVADGGGLRCLFQDGCLFTLTGQFSKRECDHLHQ
jgi:hypothetical protein